MPQVGDQLKTRRLLLPGLLTVSALTLSAGHLVPAFAVDEVALSCQSDMLVEWDVDYPTESVVNGAPTAVSATERFVDAPIIPGTTENLDVSPVSQDVDSAITVTSEHDGDIVAITDLEGSTEEGWRPTSLEVCPS